MLSGLTNVNIELTSRCNKACHMCGRRKIERDLPALAKWGDMDFPLLISLAHQLPDGIVVQFHDNGEPLLYPHLGEALRLFTRQIRCLDTNGKLLLAKAEEIIGNLETITISTFENDTEAEEQLDLVSKFLSHKKDRKPSVIIRCLGETGYERWYEKMGLLIAHRQFHSPMASADYERRAIVPEIGICLDALTHLVIKRDGAVSMCVVYDPRRKGVIGNAKDTPLDELWNGKIRQLALQNHIAGERRKNPLCQSCHSWGVPNG